MIRPRRLLLLLALAGCDRAVGPLPPLPEPVALETPAPAGSSLPNVAAVGDRIVMSWVEGADSGHALRYAVRGPDGWEDPVTVASGRDWFINWADFPSVVPLGDGRLAAHWLQRSGADRYAYDVMISQTSDGGATWSAPLRPHTDATATEHGFVSLFPHEDALGAIWLDGRRYADTDAGPATEEMSLRFIALRDSSSTDAPIDERVCDCCQTDVARTSSGPLVVYRDRSADEVRDIYVSRYTAGAWTTPRPVHADNWQIDACPVNGPQADADRDDVVVAWFTAARDTARVLVSFSADAGDTFTAPVRVDDGNPLGRVDVLLIGERRALVVWLERVGDGAELRARVVNETLAGESRTVGTTSDQRASGFPRMARRDSEVLLAWFEPGDTSRVRAATIHLTQR